MPLVVNLSTLHTLYPLSKSVAAFTEVCNRKSVGCLSACPSFLQSGINYGWVMGQYYWNYKSLIEPYKLGKIDSTQFLDNLKQIFNLVSEDDCFDVDLLVDAWNAIIGMEPDKIERFEAIVQSASKTNPVYILSNTNELNVQAILDLVHDKTTIQLNPAIQTNNKYERAPIQLAPNVFLCLSYRYQLFKTANETAEVNPGSTMSLMRYLFDHELKDIDRNQIHVVSQYPNDLTEARKLGVTNVFDDKLYFSTLEWECSTNYLQNP